jgi:hypothetical protein
MLSPRKVSKSGAIDFRHIVDYLYISSCSIAYAPLFSFQHHRPQTELR